MKKFELSKKQKRNLLRIVVAFIMFAALFTADRTVGLDSVFPGPASWVFPFILYLAVYIVIGHDVLRRAALGIVHGQVFDENFLMCVATLGAFALAVYRGVSGEKPDGFDEACAVLLFYQTGEFFQDYATGKSRRSISELMNLRPDCANLYSGGAVKKVSPEEVNVGDIIVINPGEKVPLDCVITKGFSALDLKALTGEAVPLEAGEGCEIMSGCVNLTSQLEARVTKAFYDSTVSKILDLVENASDRKAKTENFITKFAGYYTPAVVTAALLLALVPSLITGDAATWIYRALEFLVVSCPCALVISIPLSFFAGLGAASKNGILIKGSDYLERFSKADIFVCDKTGTLTKGVFSVTKIVPAEKADEILRLAAIAEQNSNHPIARSISARYGREADAGYTLTDIAGKGIMAEKDGDIILCGNEKLMRLYGISHAESADAGTAVYVAHNGVFEGFVLISDEVKPEAKQVISRLKGMGCKTVMLTGDSEAAAASAAKELGLDYYRASLLPQNKVFEVEDLLSSKKPGSVLCFVGDGINDAPVLMRSDIGVAMGGIGSDAAIEAADIVLMGDDLRGLLSAKLIAKKTMAVVKQNIFFSLGVKLVILALSAFGLAGMWLAVFGDVGVAVIAILNAMRVNSKSAGRLK